ncbi:NADH-quinone oxidoreductase subunit C [Methylocella sp.]|uniref:NADH-quinone oxidoreductase subunit C n=1 Tax=Methylocella sp. TaxID=1978226 RepID=UPI003783C1AA
MDEDLKQFADELLAALRGWVEAAEVAFGELTLSVRADCLAETVEYLRDDPSCLFVSFIDLTAVDYPAREQRFDVVTHLLSPRHNRRIRVKVATDEATPVPSLSGLYPAAIWFEREAYDMYGVFFSDHPDLRRILTDYGFDGHPLRKDFPMTGYVEVRYDDEEKRVLYEPVQLVQDYRSFDFLSPWEGSGDYVLPGDEKVRRNPA